MFSIVPLLLAPSNGWIMLQTPVHTIASNAGVEGSVIIGKLLEQDNTDLGYDAAKGSVTEFIHSFALWVTRIYLNPVLLTQVNTLTW